MIGTRDRVFDIRFRRQISFEISVRSSPVGGEVINPPVDQPVELVKRARRLLLLIHGYNVTLCSAACAYDRFREYLNIYWNARTVAVYWPGDAETTLDGSRFRRLTSRLRSGASYPFQVPRAQQAASVLSDYIARSSGERATPLEVSIVAHSLGCRLTLELLAKLRSLALAKRIHIGLVALMAAAVPVYHVRPGRNLRDALETPANVLIFHSVKDQVLKGFFPIGQIPEIPFPYGYFPTERRAIGRVGLGSNLPKNVEEIPTENDHAEYWPDYRIANGVLAALDGRSRRDPIVFRVERRPLPDGRTIVYRKVVSRNLPSSFGRLTLRAGCGDCPA